MYNKFLKRSFDLIISFLLISFLLPFLVAFFLILKFANSFTDVFFIQERIGKDERVFKLIKFKTLSDKRDSNGKLLPDYARITKIGKIIRSFSIDELPQLINVIKGDMSLIGPRPLLIDYLPLYSKEQARRHEVRPGITGWAQVNGRNNLSWEEKFKLDVWYVDNISLYLDLKIIFMTIKKVILRKDINKAGEATTERFNGKN